MAGINGIGALSHFGNIGSENLLIIFFVPVRFITSMVATASTKVEAMFPVTLAPPGKQGNKSQNIVQENKENSVSRKGAYRM